MPDQDPSPADVPEARTVPRRRTRLSLVWIIPIVAAAAGVWIAVTDYLNKGPEIKIVFDSADGLETGKTKIKFNGLIVGTIKSFKLSTNHQDVIAIAEMAPMAKDFLVKDTEFWVVSPRISGLNVSGLGTLLSGNYIGMQIGRSKTAARDFVALKSPPLVGNETPGHYFQLKTAELGSLSEGTPVFFRQIGVGQVISAQLDQDGKLLHVKIFVKAPYDQYITEDTRFWQASGVDLSLTASGLRVRTESLMSILAGGLAFGTPESDSPQPPAPADQVFTLFADRASAFEPPPLRPHTYLAVFKQSVRGLTKGAPVEVNGIPIGQVTGIEAQIDGQADEFRVPVTISLDPGRYGVKFVNFPADEDVTNSHRRIMDVLVAHGMRLQLKTGSLISGSMFVAIVFQPGLPPTTLDWSQNPVQLPTVSGKFDAIEDRVGDLLKNLDQTVTSTRGTLTNADTLLQNLNVTLASTRGTLTNADKVLNNAGALISPDSVFNAELLNLLQQGSGAAESLRVLVDYLERHPEALIRGKTGAAKP